MKTVIRFLYLSILFYSPITLLAQSSFFQAERIPPYVSVFVETDDFDDSYLQVLERELKNAPSDTIHLNMINDLAYYSHTRNLKEAEKWVRKGLQQTLHLNKKWEGKLQITQGAILLRAEQLDSAELVLQQAKTKVLKEDLPKLYTQLSYVMERRAMLDKAAEQVMNALKIGEDLNDVHAIAQAYSDLSYLFYKNKKLKDALNYGLKSETLFRKLQFNDLDFDFTLYLIGVYYKELKDYDRALSYFNESIAIGRQYGFYNNLSDVYIDVTDLYSKLGDYQAAEKAAYQALKYAELLDNDFMIMRSWLALGKLQNLTEHPQDAVKSLSTCLKVATKNFGDKFFLKQAYQELSKAYASTGKHELAYQALQVYDDLKDSLFTAESDQRIAQLQTTFKVQQKETTIRSQQSELEQQKMIQWLSYGSLSLLLILLVGLLFIFQRNRYNNLQLQELNDDLSSTNTKLDCRNAQNELLLKEIHHRVKNNLQTISSLLRLQSAQIQDADIKRVMQASQNRVQSMGLLHQKLYQGENLSNIEMRDYFKNLSESILDTYGAWEKVKIYYDMEQIELDVDTAVPIGLIVNELLTNSLKYAFPNGKQGKITLSLQKQENHYLQLIVADNGIGKAISKSVKNTGFGSQLIQLLTRQLNGVIQEDNNNGTCFIFEFQNGHT